MEKLKHYNLAKHFTVIENIEFLIRRFERNYQRNRQKLLSAEHPKAKVHFSTAKYNYLLFTRILSALLIKLKKETKEEKDEIIYDKVEVWAYVLGGIFHYWLGLYYGGVGGAILIGIGIIIFQNRFAKRQGE